MRRPVIRSRKVRAALAAPIVVASAFALYVCAAPLSSLRSELPAAGTVVLDANGTVLERDTSEGVRIPVGLDQVAPIMVAATISAEDQRFGKHPGVDPIAVVRAAIQLRSHRSGASTIQQQLARRLYLDGGGGPLPIRKLHEMVLALRIDAHNSDEAILESYLNAVYYGRGAYGVEAAARIYFGTSAKNLDAAQAAFLAGLPQLPAGYDPETHFDAAKARQAYVLGRLRDDGEISADREAEARAEELGLLPPLAPVIAPHFVAYALDELQRVRPDLAGRDGLVIETTLDAGLQQEAERIIDRRLGELQDRNVGNAAAVVLEPATGEILAMVGSADPNAPGGQINMAVTARQPGSALKPFLYAAAFEHGYTAASPLLDVATTFDTPDGPYSPLDYDRRFHGVVPLRTALASSFNIPAVETLADIGIDTFLEVANRFGLATLTDAERYGLSLTLGGGEVRLIDMAGAYGALANEGLRVPPYAIARVLDSVGNVLYEHPSAEPERVLSAENAWILTDILLDRDARVPGFGVGSPLEAPVPAAVKTGTTTGFKDNWTIGYTPGRVVAAWVGNTNNSAMDGVSGVDGAGPIWHDLIEVATGGVADWPGPPDGLVQETVCSPAGLLPSADCPSPVNEWFVRGTEPTETGHFYVRAADGSLEIDPPARARAWAADAGYELASAHPGTAATASVLVTQPPTDAVLYRSPELPRQELLLRAVGSTGTEAIEIRVDGELAGRAAGADAKVEWELDPGDHEIEATATFADGTRETARSRYEVRAR